MLPGGFRELIVMGETKTKPKPRIVVRNVSKTAQRKCLRKPVSFNVILSGSLSKKEVKSRGHGQRNGGTFLP